jgi:hypothetical protein
MAKYRKKPVVIEAEQWFKIGDYSQAIRHFADPQNQTLEGKHFSSQLCEHCKKSRGEHGWITTLEGGHIVCPGDWIITGVAGEKYPCKDSIFQATYEPVEERA